MDSERGTGRTTRQLQNAPQNAVFIACGQPDRGYAMTLARRVGRADITIETALYFEDRWHGVRRHVVIDHDAYRFMSARQATGMRACRDYLAPHGLTCT